MANCPTNELGRPLNANKPMTVNDFKIIEKMYKCTNVPEAKLDQACAVDSCITTRYSKKACSKCVFPFTDKKGKTHTACPTLPLKSPWCATKTDENGIIEEGQWGYCNMDKNCPDELTQACAADSCITTKESKKAACTKCVFPFTDKKGITHTSCTTGSLKQPWCATKTDRNGVIENGHWGFCNLDKCPQEQTHPCAVDACITTKESKKACSRCVFPFTDKKGKTHTACATAPLKHPWCATKTDENGVIEKGHWGFCDESKCPK